MSPHPNVVTRGWSLEAKVAYYSDPPNEIGCRLWRGSFGGEGYGLICGRGGKTVSVHRLAWEITNGPIPRGMCVCHRCDTPACIEISHLFLGTINENIADMDRKRRRAPPPRLRGKRVGTAKLTEAQVLAIRAMPRSQRYIGVQFGISQCQVSKIKNRKKWEHLPEQGAVK